MASPGTEQLTLIHGNLCQVEHELSVARRRTMDRGLFKSWAIVQVRWIYDREQQYVFQPLDFPKTAKILQDK